MQDDEETESNCVHSMRVTVIDELFSLKIGSERVSIQNSLKEQFETHIAFQGLSFKEDFNAIEEYLRHVAPLGTTKFTKEQLSATLMMVTAFHNIMSDKSITDK